MRTLLTLSAALAAMATSGVAAAQPAPADPRDLVVTAGEATVSAPPTSHS